MFRSALVPMLWAALLHQPFSNKRPSFDSRVPNITVAISSKLLLRCLRERSLQIDARQLQMLSEIAVCSGPCFSVKISAKFQHHLKILQKQRQSLVVTSHRKNKSCLMISLSAGFIIYPATKVNLPSAFFRVVVGITLQLASCCPKI